jgi:uncharacterized membrane protein
MDMDTPIELIVSVYRGQERAAQVLKEVREVARGDSFEIRNAALLIKDADGRVQIRDTEDVGPGMGALFGAVTGALVGLLAGPAGAVAGALAGAATGGITAGVVDMGFSNDQLQELKNSMPADSSALVLLIEHTWVDRLVQALEERQGRLFHNEVPRGMMDQYRPR